MSGCGLLVVSMAVACVQFSKKCFFHLCAAFAKLECVTERSNPLNIGGGRQDAVPSNLASIVAYSVASATCASTVSFSFACELVQRFYASARFGSVTSVTAQDF